MRKRSWQASYSKRVRELKDMVASLPILKERSFHEVNEDLEADHIFVIFSEAVNLNIESS